jgi:hypothetical protein
MLSIIQSAEVMTLLALLCIPLALLLKSRWRPLPEGNHPSP